jgi:tricorn protease
MAAYFSRLALLSLGALLWTQCFANGSGDAGPLLLRDPSLSRTHVAFSYAGSIWVANRDGSGLHRVTEGPRDRKPYFSPDGSQIAYSADYVDNPYQAHHSGGIYIVPTAGGYPRQLTFHSADMAVVAWSADGKRLLFSSRRMNAELHHQMILQLFSIPVQGGFVSQVPLPRGVQAALSADGKRVAYVPNARFQPEWKHYRGGQTTPIWIANLADSHIETRIPRDNSNDSNPMWVGDTIYFLSDRDGPVTLFAYDLHSRQVRKVINNSGFDIKSASAASDSIVYDQLGSLHLLDLASGRDRTLDIRPSVDSAEVQPHLQKLAADKIRFLSLSPDGRELLFGVHGEILTAPVDGHGEFHDVTRTTDVVERDPSWSPDGRSIAYFSDESGEYALHIRDREGREQARRIDLGNPPSFYYRPTWSPDARMIAYSDVRLNYGYVELDTGRRVHVDTDLAVDSDQRRQMTWSPDSRWLSYIKQLPNHLHAAFLYSVDDGKSYQLTDGNSDVLHLAFDRDGQHLYFTASTDIGFAATSMDMSGMQRPVTRHVYAVNLEGLRGSLRDGSGAVDLSQRMSILPVPARHYYDLLAGPPGTLYLVEGALVDPLRHEEGLDCKVRKLDLHTGRAEEVLDDVVDFSANPDTGLSLRISLEGGRILYAKAGKWFSIAAAKTAVATPVNFDNLEIQVDPRAEWRHLLTQTWRSERDFFYDPGLHGVDITAIKAKYTPFLDHLANRDDLNYLFNDMLANITVGHMGAFSAHTPESSLAETGLLGADYEVSHGRYRFARVYASDPWNPDVRGPLAQPGMDVRVGDELLMVNGHDVRPDADIYRFFAHTVGKPVVLRIAPHGDAAHAREITVVPVADETSLRNAAWVEDNRTKVSALSGGRVAYIYLPDVYIEGYQHFNREYFSQLDKQAVIVDERDNYGGINPDYIIDTLSRHSNSYFYTRYGRDILAPQEVLNGPKVLMVNEMSASGGDELAWMFRQSNLGPLVGKRTWGGLVGGYTVPVDWIDDGVVATPDLAFYDPQAGAWEVENHGVPPDFEVEEDPQAVREGHDPQLEKAVAVILDLLHKRPAPLSPGHPSFPTYPHEGIQ